MIRVSVALAALVLSGCAGNKIPPLPQSVDMCANYTPVRIIEEAARAMIAKGDKSELDKNASNNRFYYEKCRLNDAGRLSGPV